TALAGGHVDMRIGKVGSVYAQLKAGIIRVIGVMDTQRSKFVPDVPTMIEQGYKDYTWYNATGISVPKGTPSEIVDILANVIKKAVEQEDAKKKLNDLALNGYYLGPKEFTKYWKDFEKTIAPLVKEAKSQQ
ncbi:MAG: Bug family tripartite tricarboxylate transporter substrate binding protein, partial [Bacteroidota bacterium]